LRGANVGLWNEECLLRRGNLFDQWVTGSLKSVQ